MGLPIGADARVRACDRQGAGSGGTTELAPLGTALERARLAVGELRAALDEAARHYAEARAGLAQVTALAGLCEARDGRVLCLLPHSAPGRGHAAGLSDREVEVLRLLAAGGSNRQIAQALFLSPRTVQRHVANAYLKIGAHCRAEATTYVLRHRLT